MPLFTRHNSYEKMDWFRWKLYVKIAFKMNYKGSWCIYFGSYEQDLNVDYGKGKHPINNHLMPYVYTFSCMKPIFQRCTKNCSVNLCVCKMRTVYPCCIPRKLDVSGISRIINPAKLYTESKDLDISEISSFLGIQHGYTVLVLHT